MFRRNARKLFLEEYGNDQNTCRSQALQFREPWDSIDDTPPGAASQHELCQFGSGHCQNDIGVRRLRLIAQCERDLIIIAELDRCDFSRFPDLAVGFQALLPGPD
jgi:hypothetical protein